ncbi:DUF1727 domain-containing protein [Candidatus Saccharibacteria bacterium]|nr:DUF1727 domain-containing protein [Candidatus Saccharibacteria bacterium]
MSIWRDRISIIAGSTVRAGMSLLGRQSTALPGYVAERIGNDPLAKLLEGKTYAHRILITGTNGKTTTTLLLKKCFEKAGMTVVNNGSGSNLYRGVTTVLLNQKAQGSNTVLLLEVDEASMPAIAQAVQPTHIVVLNLFRDQLDRYGEVDLTQKILSQAIQLVPTAQLVLNADDPHVTQLARYSRTPALFFGLDSMASSALSHDHASDIPLSPDTKSPLKYSHRFYGHIGHYQAVDKSFKRPHPECRVTVVKKAAGGKSKYVLLLNKKQHNLKTDLEGIYSAYNIAAAFLAAFSCSVSSATIVQAVESTKAGFGRQERITMLGREFLFLLVKNPTGFNQVIQTYFQGPGKKIAVIIINDNFADGRDVSWLWDVAFEDMQGLDRVIVSGSRAYDMALRLYYAGFECEVVVDSTEALKRASKISHHGQIFVLPTYTALLKIRKSQSLALEHQI